jgi:hypothetical protein
MSRRTQIVLTDRQHAFLLEEKLRTGVSLAELVRRAIDETYRAASRPRVPGVEFTLGVWRRPDAGAIGRRLERRARLGP